MGLFDFSRVGSLTLFLSVLCFHAADAIAARDEIDAVAPAAELQAGTEAVGYAGPADCRVVEIGASACFGTAAVVARRPNSPGC